MIQPLDFASLIVGHGTPEIEDVESTARSHKEREINQARGREDELQSAAEESLVS